MNSTRGLLPIILVVAGIALAFGWPTRNGDFLSGDDQRLVTDHVLVNHPSLEHAWKLLTIVHGDLYQPLPMLSLQANYALAAPEPESRFGVRAYGFHLTNIILHAINAVLACLVARRISLRSDVAFLTGAAFACHPFALEPVAWVSGRMILMATMFALLTLLACLRRRPDGGGRWPWAAGPAWVLSLLSKVLPSVPLAAAWCDAARNGRPPRRVWIVYALLLALGLGAGWAAMGATAEAGFGQAGLGQAGLRQAADAEMTAGVPLRLLLSVGYYLENYARPARLSAWSPPPGEVGFASGAALRALAALGVFALLVGVARRRVRTAFIGLVAFAILLAPFLAATLSRRMLAADRYMYLPMLGLHLAVAAALVRGGEWLARRTSARLARGGAAVAAGAGLAVWLWIGRGLAPAWADTVSRDRRVAAVHADSVLAQSELARAYLFADRPDRALAVVREARERWPDHPRLAAQAGEAHAMKGDWRRAERELRFAAERMPGHVRTQYALALAWERLGRRAEARALLRRILEDHERFAPAAAALARSYTATGETDAAIDAWETALARNPFHRDGLYELALLRIRRGELGAAENLLRRVLDLDPEDRPARFHLGVVLFNGGRRQAALEVYRRLLAEDASDTTVRLNLAHGLAGMDRTAAAEAEYRRILADRPDHLQAALGLHELLHAARRWGDLLDLWTRFDRAAGGTAQTRAYLAWAHALNDRMDRARAIVDSIPADSPDRAVANWALVPDALRRRAWDDLERLLGEPAADVTAGDLGWRWEASRVIRPALLELPESIRQSTAGRYVLARLFLFEGNIDAARAAAEPVAAARPADRWTVAAAKLRALLN